MIPRVDYEIATDHSREEWRYWLDERGMMLVLDSYKMQVRPTKRHGWRSVRWWERLARKGTKQMDRADVPTPAEVRAEVLRKFRESITIE
jgi:hypothetical protein